MAVQKILKEDTETTIEVSDEDVTLYAEQLGIDVSKEKHLLWIARKGLETPVPKPWCPVEDEKGRIYYYNHMTDKSMWDHPADEQFRKLVKQERDKQINTKENTELGIESELSSLDDVPPITSAKSSISAQLDENNLKMMGRRQGSLHRLQELGKEKSASASYLKNSAMGDKFDSRSLDTKSSGRRNRFGDPLIKVTEDDALNHSTDEDLSTGLDGIGFDRFAEQYGIMDASQLSSAMPSSKATNYSYLKMASQPMPKSFLKTLFNTSNDPDESVSEARKSGDVSFADFLKEAEEYSNKSVRMDKLQSENSLEEKSIEHNYSKSVSSSSEVNISMIEEKEEIQSSQKKQDIFASNNEKLKQDILAIEESWKIRLEEKEKEMRTNFEKHIAELQEKLAEEERIEEKKLNDSILLMKEENAVILSKQELVLTEELEADLESVKEEIEMKKHASLQVIHEQEEEYTKKLEEKRVNAKEEFESKLQNLHLEMGKKLEEKKQDIERDHQQEIDALTAEHAKHLEELKNDIQQMGKKLEEKKQDIERDHQQEIDALTAEHAKHLEELKNDIQQEDLELPKEKAALEEELNALKEEIEAEKEALKQLQESKHTLEEQKVQLSKSLQEHEMQKRNNEEEMKLLQEKNGLEISSEISALKEELIALKENIEAEKEALEHLQESKQAIEKQKVQLSESLQELDMLRHNNEEEMKKLLQEKEDLKLSDEISSLKEELNTLKEQIEVEKEALEQLQKEKQAVAKQKIQLSELLQMEETVKHNIEEEKDKLLHEKSLLQNEVIELKNEVTEPNQILECLGTNKCTLEREVELIKEELNKQNSLSQQIKQLPTIDFVDKFTDTADLLVIDNPVSKKEESKCDHDLSSVFDQEKESQDVNHQFENYGTDENKMPDEEDKMERLEIKMVSLEKAFRLLELKIGNTADQLSFNNHGSHPISNEIPKTSAKCECCSKAFPTIFSSGINNSASRLFSSEELEKSCLQNTSDNKYSVFYMPNNTSDTHQYENNLAYNMFSKDLCQQEMNLALSPIYISESNSELFPFLKSDSAIQLQHCKEKFRNLQSKHETSQINVELLKNEIFNDISRKDGVNNNEMQNLSFKQIPDPVYGASELEDQYMQNALPGSALSNIITFPTKTTQNNDWHSPLVQNAQRLIQKEQQFRDKADSYIMDEEKENNPLDQFLTLTESVLDKELELFSKDKSEKHYLSYSVLNQGNFSNSSRNIAYPGLHTNHKPMYIHQPSVIGELITEKEDWMEKIGSMYQKIRTYERDLILKRSLKTNV